MRVGTLTCLCEGRDQRLMSGGPLCHSPPHHHLCWAGRPATPMLTASDFTHTDMCYHTSIPELGYCCTSPHLGFTGALGAELRSSCLGRSTRSSEPLPQPLEYTYIHIHICIHTHIHTHTYTHILVSCGAVERGQWRGEVGMWRGEVGGAET